MQVLDVTPLNDVLEAVAKDIQGTSSPGSVYIVQVLVWESSNAELCFV